MPLEDVPPAPAPRGARPGAEPAGDLVFEIANQDQGLVVHLAVAGTCDTAAAAALEDRLANLIRVRQPNGLHLDLSRVDVQDVAAVAAVLAQATRELAELGGVLTVTGASLD